MDPQALYDEWRASDDREERRRLAGDYNTWRACGGFAATAVTGWKVKYLTADTERWE